MRGEMAGVIILLEEEASDYSLLTSHGISETRLLGEPGAEHAAAAAAPHHPPPAQNKNKVMSFWKKLSGMMP